MKWNRVFILFSTTIAISVHVSSENGNNLSPIESLKDSLKVWYEVKLQNLIFFTSPKAVESIEIKESREKKSPYSSAI